MQKKPNILIIMVDQLNGTLFPDGPADWLHTPNLKKLAARSARFENCYTSSPLCAPARASFMSGQLPRRTRVYDNAAEFASDIPTYAHHLRRAGYYTCLSGKMHFVGPDQMHGFEDRLTTDIYPADFGWTPDYRKPGERIDWWYHNMGSVTGAGVAEISNQMEYDDNVAHEAKMKIYDLARGLDDHLAGEHTVAGTDNRDRLELLGRLCEFGIRYHVAIPNVEYRFGSGFRFGSGRNGGRHHTNTQGRQHYLHGVFPFSVTDSFCRPMAVFIFLKHNALHKEPKPSGEAAK